MNEYISREKILDIVSQYCPDDDGSCSKADVDLREMLDEIEALPAADVQPVKRGRWIKAHDKQGSYFLCSNCGTVEKTESDQDDTVWQHDEYCRKCGARMDGEQND